MNRASDFFHPAVGFGYCAAVIASAMLFLHPLWLAAGFFCAAAVSLLYGGRMLMRTLGFGLPVFVLIALLNPLTSHHGATVLFTVGGSAFTLESLAYGLCSGGMLLVVFLWFGVYNRIVTAERFMSLFSKAVPAASLLVTMTQRMIPLFGRRTQTISAAQKALGCDITAGSPAKRFRNGLRITSILMTWSLEEGLDTADSMKARGYGAARRSSYSIYRFRRSDAAALSVIALCFAGCLAGYFLTPSFRFYPKLRMAPLGQAGLISLIAYGLLCLLPLAERAIFSLRYGRR